MDLRHMPMAELARLLRDIANELQQRGNGGASGYNRATGYGQTGYGTYGGYGQAYGQGYGNQRSGQEFRNRGNFQGGGRHRRHRDRRREFRPDDRRPVEPPAPIDDPPPSAGDAPPAAT